MKGDYVQYGCGWCAPASWLNFDSSPTLRFERLPIIGRVFTKNAARFPDNIRYGDIVWGLPLAEASCRGMFCSHVLEHLALEDLDVALRHTYRYLQPDGVFRFVLPDLEQLVRAYLADDDALRFMEATHLGQKRRPRGLAGHAVEWFGNSAHRWMWDEKSLAAKLREHGFQNIRRASFGDAEDRRFDDVEQKERFDGCLAMQCSR